MENEDIEIIISFRSDGRLYLLHIYLVTIPCYIKRHYVPGPWEVTGDVLITLLPSLRKRMNEMSEL